MYAMSDDAGHIHLVDAATGNERQSLTGPGQKCGQLVFSPDGQRVAAVRSDNAIDVWETQSGRRVALFPPQGKPSNLQLSIDLSVDGRRLVARMTKIPHFGFTGTMDFAAFDIDTKTEVGRFSLPLSKFVDVRGARFSPDSRLYVSGNTTSIPDGTPVDIQIWDIAAGRIVRILPDHNGGEFSGQLSSAFSPDGRLLAIGEASGLLRVWELSTGREATRFIGHRAAVGSANFSPDGRLLVAASEDVPCFVWNVFDPPPGPPTVADPDTVWNDLADLESARAFAAVRRLVASPVAAVGLIRAGLRPAVPANRGTVEGLLGDLGADDSAVQDAAAAELARLADRLGPTLARTRASALPGVRNRLDGIMAEAAKVPSAARLRQDRALQALELIGTPAAAAVLAELAGGAPEDRLTTAAAAGRDRLLARLSR
jgi:WD40 repeat protein